mmetsp:Transcript_12781/g.17211  ORF Transcript_12781/g.17211 Transcript_12781/m.17211 type:complete len:469 (-) Transcript_12781:335-1741(-)
MILDHMLGVKLYVLEVLKGLSVVAVGVVSATAHVLEPHGLVVVNADVVAAVFHKDIHDRGSTLHIAGLQREHRADRVDCAVRLVQVACLFVKNSSALPVTRLLVDLALQGVELEESRRVLNGFIDEAHGFSQLILEHVVLREEVVQPEKHSGVLLVVIARSQSHLLLHGGDTISEELANDLDLAGDGVELSQVHHQRGHTLNHEGSHVLLQVLPEEGAVQVAQTDTQVRVDSREALHVLVQDSLDDILVRLRQLSIALGNLHAFSTNDLLVSLQVGRVVLQQSLEVLDSLGLISEALAEAALEVGAGDLITDELLVLVEESEGFLGLALGLEGADSDKDDLVGLVSLHARLGGRVCVELQHAVDGLQHAGVVAIGIASCAEGHPVRHNTGLLNQHLSAGFLKACKVSQVDLKLIKLAHGVLALRITLEGKKECSSGLLVVSAHSETASVSELKLLLSVESLLTSLCGG